MNYTLYLCALCLCMKAQSLEALPLVALVLSFCGWRFCCIFHLAHQPPSVNIQFRGTVLGSETDLFRTQENKVCHCFHCFLLYLQGSDGTRCHDLSFLNVEF
uniref:Secreted protein n=1 Tax=Capra hircus TaxID=9925 RepID=A0A452EEA5_CAPHI